MPFLALGVLALAMLVFVGRKPLMAKARVRFLALAFAVAALGAGVWDLLRGGWAGGAILLASAVWLAASSRSAARPAGEGMTRAEAAAMLGVAEGASSEEVQAAFRRLMLRVHPDQGGAPGLAAQLNAARALLLERNR